MKRRLATLARLLPLVPLGLGTIGLVLGAVGPARAADGEREAWVLPATGVVDGVMAGYLGDGVAKAAREGAEVVVVKLNTPGGSLDATQQITSTFLEAEVPVIVWVAPAGGRAASAGTFITLAAHLSWMAPGTNIGAASPVSGSGEDIPGTLGEKVLNDAIANITSIAEARGRPVEWAVSTVKDAASYTAMEAVAAGAVDGIAATIEEVLVAADGRTVTLASGEEVTLATADAVPVEVPMNPLQGFLHLLSDPNIAFILFTVGFYGLIFELQNPNFVTGIIGAIALLLAFVGFGSLPLNVAGLLLIVFGLVLLFLETQVASHGLLAIGAVVCVALGAAALYTEPGTPTAPDVAVALPVLLTVVGLTGAFAVLLAVVAYRSRHSPESPILVGSLEVVGQAGKVARPLDPVGSVLAVGEEWTARSVDGRALPRGAPVRVVRMDGLTLYVEPADAAPAS
ncbi:MAG: nodulation protein NfeD [Chloroflexi bacterium]|jgi:membrane-bound serine protease (ClpP class)|nr:nodulation protein NfeD [Chloroflexota bacterium]